ncbi:uncharacterized protein CLUP02_03190 [Colletotrichum lupini]|uniref:Uncharacterized protein n=1 Tax=Colletotrichum lupini TaxID=145971 RepID=A0A9Q8SHY6_9PEZI|nr:uncharacterized protein CLUP02_03190 [Colletotrichum lupini]UQC77719.1 hypothetical protein CLUP02_03190 [Colletotrichum lupini]
MGRKAASYGAGLGLRTTLKTENRQRYRMAHRGFPNAMCLKGKNLAHTLSISTSNVNASSSASIAKVFSPSHRQCSPLDDGRLRLTSLADPSSRIPCQLVPRVSSSCWPQSQQESRAPASSISSSSASEKTEVGGQEDGAVQCKLDENPENEVRDDVERLLVIESNARGSHQTTQDAAVVAGAATVTAALHDTIEHDKLHHVIKPSQGHTLHVTHASPAGRHRKTASRSAFMCLAGVMHCVVACVSIEHAKIAAGRSCKLRRRLSAAGDVPTPMKQPTTRRKSNTRLTDKRADSPAFRSSRSAVVLHLSVVSVVGRRCRCHLGKRRLMRVKTLVQDGAMTLMLETATGNGLREAITSDEQVPLLVRVDELRSLVSFLCVFWPTLLPPGRLRFLHGCARDVTSLHPGPKFKQNEASWLAPCVSSSLTCGLSVTANTKAHIGYDEVGDSAVDAGRISESRHSGQQLPTTQDGEMRLDGLGNENQGRQCFGTGVVSGQQNMGRGGHACRRGRQLHPQSSPPESAMAAAPWMPPSQTSSRSLPNPQPHSYPTSSAFCIADLWQPNKRQYCLLLPAYIPSALKQTDYHTRHHLDQSIPKEPELIHIALDLHDYATRGINDCSCCSAPGYAWLQFS